ESFNDRGSTPSVVQAGVTLSATPTVPGSFIATALSGTQVRLTWADSSGEDGYRVYQWDGVSAWNVIASPAANSTSYTVSGLTAGRTYYFYVEALNAFGSEKTKF